MSGVVFSSSLLDELQAALADTGRSYLGPANFSGATFTQHANFQGATFTRHANFSGAAFTQHGYFFGATFTQYANFSGATFTQHANFIGATFTQHANFSGATFTQHANFDAATFTQHADFGSAAFTRYAEFVRATFTQYADFRHAIFTEAANFRDAKILGRFVLRCPVDALVFSGAELAGELVADVAARKVYLQRLRGSGSMTLRVRAGRVDLAELIVSGPVTIQGLQAPLKGTDENNLADPASGQLPAASIVSLREVDAERLVLTDLDLTRCLFAGMHRVEQLRLDGQCTFATDPRGRRRTLAEEHHWRADQASSRIGALIGRVRLRAGSWTSAPDDNEVVSPARLQVLYRQLRVATETSKNEPGAADFYYGEMEMRRHSKAAARTERIVVTLYWLISGYGLRASRAIATLAAAITVATIIFATIGFAHTSTTIYRPVYSPANGAVLAYQQSKMPGDKPGWGAALYHAIDSSTSLLHTPGDEALTTTGRATEITLRLLGPVLLGLAVLAIRGRVKR